MKLNAKVAIGVDINQHPVYPTSEFIREFNRPTSVVAATLEVTSLKAMVLELQDRIAKLEKRCTKS